MAKNPKPLRKRKRGYLSVQETTDLRAAITRFIEAINDFNKEKK